jgi:hypothetical protein
MIYKIYSSINTESLESWIWTNHDVTDFNNFIQIKNVSNGKTITCFKRTIDDNFLRLYNDDKNRIQITPDDDVIIMNEYYRRKLEIETQKYYDLEIIKIKPYLRPFANWNHPNLQVQFVNRLTFVSILLGIISFLLGLISIIITVC